MGMGSMFGHEEYTFTKGGDKMDGTSSIPRRINKMDVITGGKALKAKREELKFTQKDLAQKAEVPQQYVSRIEAGILTYPSFDVVIRIGRALGIGPDELARLFEV
jgi:DNA-binding XRE family transcriptional regulator